MLNGYTAGLMPDRTGKNSRYAEYVRRGSAIEPRISGGVRRNMAYAELGASGRGILGAQGNLGEHDR